jgi:hypothetical protein
MGMGRGRSDSVAAPGSSRCRGAGGGTRTHIGTSPPDPKSGAYANSATPAWYGEASGGSGVQTCGAGARYPCVALRRNYPPWSRRRGSRPDAGSVDPNGILQEGRG